MSRARLPVDCSSLRADRVTRAPARSGTALAGVRGEAVEGEPGSGSSLPAARRRAPGLCPESPVSLGGPPPSHDQPTGAYIRLRPQIRRDNPLNLSISISGGKENKSDSLSSGERNGISSAPSLVSLTVNKRCGVLVQVHRINPTTQVSLTRAINHSGC